MSERRALPRGMLLALAREADLRLMLAAVGARAATSPAYAVDPRTIATIWRGFGGGRLPAVRVFNALAPALATREAAGWAEGSGGDSVLAMVGAYEDCLNAVESGARRRTGVYHTPLQLADLAVRAAESGLRDCLGLAAGWSDPDVVAIDLATGTGVFFVALRQGLEGSDEATGPPLFGYELCPVAAALARLRLEPFGGAVVDLRVADALASTELPRGVLSSRSVPVILGNPPYRGHSANRAAPVAALLDDYRHVDGERLGERNPKWLQDDYVKFFRLAHAVAARSRRAVVALVTNHAWLDNPTFRGMRRALLDDFDELRVLDLGGNRRRQSDGRECAGDENVFGVSQGIALCLLVRARAQVEVRRLARVHHGRLRGSRVQKLECMRRSSLELLAAAPVAPQAPGYELTPRDAAVGESFAAGMSLPEIFPLHGPGVVTSRDALVLDVDRSALRERVRLLADPRVSDREVRRRLPELRESRSWRLEPARRELRESDEPPRIIRYLYRPFQSRWACLHPALVERRRHRVTRHLTGRGALALVAMRQVALDGAPYSHVLVARNPVDNRLFYSNRGMVTVMPLWTTPGTARQRANLAPEFLERCARLRGAAVPPLEAFDFVYASILDPAYRERFADWLALDYPRVIFPSSPARFETLVTAGRRLRELHLEIGSPPLPAGDVTKPLPHIGGHPPERILSSAPRPTRTRAILAETAELLAALTG